MPIRHLVLAGGGPTGFATYGLLRRLHEAGVWSRPAIESIYGSSVGALIGVMIALDYQWDWLDDYLIKRPWEKATGLSANSLPAAFRSKGLLGRDFFERALGPLLTAKGLEIEATLLELHQHTGVDVHMFCADLNPRHPTKIDLSHSTHPDLPVVSAVQRSASLPFIFKPVCCDGGCFVDGGLLNNFPLQDCVDRKDCNSDEILAVRNVWRRKHVGIDDDTHIFDYVLAILRRFHYTVCTEHSQPTVKHTVDCIIHNTDTLQEWIEPFSVENARADWVAYGVEQADVYLAQRPDDGTCDNDSCASTCCPVPQSTCRGTA